jgi:hypothetical protein
MSSVVTVSDESAGARASGVVGRNSLCQFSAGPASGLSWSLRSALMDYGLDSELEVSLETDIGCLLSFHWHTHWHTKPILQVGSTISSHHRNGRRKAADTSLLHPGRPRLWPGD